MSNGDVTLRAENTSAATTLASRLQTGTSKVGVGAAAALDLEQHNLTEASVQTG
jgi:hypothetical protein